MDARSRRVRPDQPDMLHRSLLPGHQRWSRFFGLLQYVVIDECHHYRGVFGAHTAQIIRRLRRVCAEYGAHPDLRPRLGDHRRAGTDRQPPDRRRRRGGDRGRLPTGPPPARTLGATVRRRWGRRARCPGASVDDRRGRRSAHRPGHRRTPARLPSSAPAAAPRRSHSTPAGSSRRSTRAWSSRVAAYRGGYLPEERRSLESALRSGELLGMAATNALELGIDISGLDAVLMAGFPGTRAAFWQQAGRAGRGGRDALAVLVARDDPLDTYLVQPPEALLGAPVEATVFDPENPYVLRPHLCAAAAEIPLTRPTRPLRPARPRPARRADGRGSAAQAPARLVLDRSQPRQRPGRHPVLRWPGDQPRREPAPVGSSAPSTGPLHHGTAHQGAVYLHQGETYLVG